MKTVCSAVVPVLTVWVLGCGGEPASPPQAPKPAPTKAPRPPAEAPETHAAAEKAAVAAAQAWLELLDTAQYAASWDAAAEYFRNAVPKSKWEAQSKAVRGPLGRMRSRKLKSKQFRTTLPGAPDGQYVVVQFDASFEKKKSAVETVTPMLDADATWRVSGYYIR